MAGDYWSWIRQEAGKVRSDGCTGVVDVHLECCYEHDLAYRTGRCPRSAYAVGWVNAEVLTKRDADKRFRSCIQQRSKLGKWSPLSWWRWAGVALMGDMDGRQEYYLSILIEGDKETITIDAD